jgi:hypothetical protein
MIEEMPRGWLARQADILDYRNAALPGDFALMLGTSSRDKDQLSVLLRVV